MVVSKRGSTICELRFGDGRIKQVRQFKYLVSASTEEETHEVEKRRGIRTGKEAKQSIK